VAYVTILAAIVLDERARGTPLEDLERRWSLPPLSGLDESWRDTAFWMLSGLASLLNVRCFYHHLREVCDANPEDTVQVKRSLSRLRGQSYELLERLKYCSALGALLRGVRQANANTKAQIVGIGSIRRLEASGITTLTQVAAMSVDQLMDAGLAKPYALQIRRYMSARMR
jgi:helicase